jgi:hypothetical protein
MLDLVQETAAPVIITTGIAGRKDFPSFCQATVSSQDKPLVTFGACPEPGCTALLSQGHKKVTRCIDLQEPGIARPLLFST